jgi:mevalonate kinase
LKTGDFYSAGKLLLTGEYLVLCGAEALAIPLKFGQGMTVLPGKDAGMLYWTTFVMDKEWFSARFHIPDFEIIETSHTTIAARLMEVLEAGAGLNPEFFNANEGYLVRTNLEFDIRWGLGSSSSLLSNIAWWMDIDPYSLFKRIYPGSGYDVYCARSKKPILFQLSGEMPTVREVEFLPPFHEKLYFVYLGQKQDSQKSVSRFRSDVSVNQDIVESASLLTHEMIAAKSLDEFAGIMTRHEELISSLLNMEPVGKMRFLDFHGSVKSLGAWGGDFILAACSEPVESVRDYFSSKGLAVIFRYHDMAL